MTTSISAILRRRPTLAGRRLGVLAPLLLATVVAGAGGAERLRPGGGDFVFTGSEGAQEHPVRVWYHRPPHWRPDDPIVFVMHGTERDGAAYRAAWVPEAERHGFLLVVPEFSLRHYPAAATYQQGNVLHGGTPVDSAHWSFTTVEALFDEVQRRTGSSRESYRLYGHSAGAQFVHRMLLFMPHARIERAAVANAGWYTLPTLEARYPYGLAGTLEPSAWEERLRVAFAREMPLLLGSADTLTSDPNLRTTPQAMEQGPDRLSRGHAFHRAAESEARRLGVPLRWRVETVPAVGHSNRQMAHAAASALGG
jgi:hypothetical protein